MLVQEITPAIADALVNLLEQLDCVASPVAALLASGYTTLRSAEFRLRILVDSWVLNLSAIGERGKAGDPYVDANADGQIIGRQGHRLMLKGKGCKPAMDGAFNGTSLYHGPVWQGPAQPYFDIANLGQTELPAAERESRLGIGERIEPVRSFESRKSEARAREILEGLVQSTQDVLQDLRIDVLVDRERCLQLGELC
jgi:hypothetical protein